MHSRSSRNFLILFYTLKWNHTHLMISPSTHFQLEWFSYTKDTKDFILLRSFTKCKALVSWDGHHQKSPVQAGICVVGSSLADLGDSKLGLRQQSTAEAAKANWILGYICRGVTGTDPLYSVQVRLYLEFSSGPHISRKIQTNWREYRGRLWRAGVPAPWGKTWRSDVFQPWRRDWGPHST